MGKPVCSYSEKCYRKKEEHFVQYDHPHLNELLDKTGVVVPEGYQLKTSPQTLLLQLKIVSNLRGDVPPSQYSLKSPPLAEKISSSSLSNKEGCSSQGYSPKEVTASSSHPARSQRDSDISTNPETQTNSSKSAKSQQKPTKPQTSNEKLLAMRQSLEFISNNANRIHVTIEEKWKASAPYYILYTSLEDNQDMPNDRFSIIFSELLDASFGSLENSLLINFMVQFGWVLACYYAMGCRSKPMTLIYGECDEELNSRFSSFLTSDKVKPPSAFGSHHTKMMIYSYVDESIRVVVCTANLVESDWCNRTQGVWISPKCPRLPEDAGDLAGDSETDFKSDLLHYLSSYKLASLQPWIEKVQKADMSHIKVVFVASVPGSHSANEGWGQSGVRKALRQNVPTVQDGDFVIAQCSSIGSLGSELSSYLGGEILETLTTNQMGHSRRTPIHLIYPSFRDVEASADGLLGGGCLPYSSNVHRKQEWLHNYLRRWKANSVGRTRAVPHIKSYTRVSGDLRRAAYFLLTSANMSKAAWGKYNKSGGLSILSYEAGVLLLPRFLIGADYLPLTDEESEADFGERKPKFTLPFDLPLTNYSDTDIPWFIDNLPM